MKTRSVQTKEEIGMTDGSAPLAEAFQQERFVDAARICHNLQAKTSYTMIYEAEMDQSK